MASGGGNGNRRGGGFSGFGGNFSDPFANFGMGSQRGRSIFDVFDNDPFFNDPFFTRPFGSMFGGQGGGLFGGPQGFLGNSVFDSHQTAPRAPPAGGYLEDAPRNNPPQYQHQRDPIIEELPDSDSDADGEPRSSSRPGQHQQPIIEHPDDDVRPEPQERQRPPQGTVVRAGPLPVFNDNGGGRVYSFQSSSVSYGGPNGTYYSSSAARRLGPDGVIEEEFQEKDSTSGHEVKRHSRGLGVKLFRCRDVQSHGNVHLKGVSRLWKHCTIYKKMRYQPLSEHGKTDQSLCHSGIDSDPTQLVPLMALETGRVLLFLEVALHKGDGCEFKNDLESFKETIRVF